MPSHINDHVLREAVDPSLESREAHKEELKQFLNDSFVELDRHLDGVEEKMEALASSTTALTRAAASLSDLINTRFDKLEALIADRPSKPTPAAAEPKAIPAELPSSRFGPASIPAEMPAEVPNDLP